MTEDVDMDAPQISTLREETTPEPNPARSSKFRVKLLVNDKSEGSRAGSTSSKHGRPASDDDDEDEDDDEEEDQLIDDDDDEVAVAKPAPTIVPQVAAVLAVATPPKRGGRGRGGRGGRGRGRGRAGAPAPGPGITWFETVPSEAKSSQDARADVWDPSSVAGSVVPTPARKKPGPPKGSTMNRTIKKRAPKPAKTAVSLLKDDADNTSEAYTGTAASSPIPLEGSPEPDIPLSSIMPSHHALEDAPLDGVPLPVYPLPSKPFPVQPPPKIGTGFAPVIPLDKTGKPVRKWRQVNREVRGIAGGRWFVKSWVGEKESEFAHAVAASQAAAQAMAGDSLSTAGLSLPNLSTISISGTGRGRGRGARHGVAGHASTVASSRAGSVMPESISAQLKKQRGSGPNTPSVDIPPAPVPVSAPPTA